MKYLLLCVFAGLVSACGLFEEDMGWSETKEGQTATFYACGAWEDYLVDQIADGQSVWNNLLGGFPDGTPVLRYGGRLLEQEKYDVQHDGDGTHCAWATGSNPTAHAQSVMEQNQDAGALFYKDDDMLFFVKDTCVLGPEQGFPVGTPCHYSLFVHHELGHAMGMQHPKSGSTDSVMVHPSGPPLPRPYDREVFCDFYGCSPPTTQVAGATTTTAPSHHTPTVNVNCLISDEAESLHP